MDEEVERKKHGKRAGAHGEDERISHGEYARLKGSQEEKEGETQYN
jgi:hypothetical protein